MSARKVWSETSLVVRSFVVTGLILAAILIAIGFRARSQDREAMQAARPSCVARLGSEQECDARFDSNHRQCFNYNNQAPSRFNPARSFNAKGYLDCVVQGPDAWAASERAARVARERADR